MDKQLIDLIKAAYAEKIAEINEFKAMEDEYSARALSLVMNASHDTDYMAGVYTAALDSMQIAAENAMMDLGYEIVMALFDEDEP